MYSMVTTVSHTVLHFWKLLREKTLKVFIPRKNILVMCYRYIVVIIL